MKQESIAAYEEALKPFHGWVSRRGFGIALSGCPDWSEVRERAGFPSSNESLRAELRAWAVAIRKLQKCMLGIHEKLDLEDRRSSV